MNLAAFVVVALAVVVLAAVVLGRQLTVTVHGIRDIKATVGQPNGNGTIATMNARMLGEIAEVRTEMEKRTHILRDGATVPEELGAYTQDRMHDVLSAVSKVAMKVDIVWVFLQEHGYDLPDLPKEENP